MNDILLSRLDSLPEFLKSRHLVELGLYPSQAAVYLSRHRGEGPDYIKLKSKILYPKAAVLTFIERHLRAGSVPKTNKSEVVAEKPLIF